ncbi:MAG: hypothetical protein NWE95_02815 [Candidatus Bathyarchaeota archaeon]|nr:hypothetical protein [Candidatus Bathyarchaeota archaeon]
MEPLAQKGAVEANPGPEYPTIFIQSPSPYPIEIYQETSILIQVWREFSPFEKTRSVDIYYRLDGGPKTELSITTFGTSTDKFGVGTLENLTDGFHTVTAYSTDTQGKTISDSVTFLVNTTIIFPKLLFCPTNTTYNTKEIPLTYIIDDPKCAVTYRLDPTTVPMMDTPKPLYGNTTLSELSEGKHTITVKATNSDTGFFSKQTANFTIDTTKPAPTPTVPESSTRSLKFPAELAIIFLTIMALAVAVVLMKFAYKRRRPTAQTTLLGERNYP